MSNIHNPHSSKKGVMTVKPFDVNQIEIYGRKERRMIKKAMKTNKYVDKLTPVKVKV